MYKALTTIVLLFLCLGLCAQWSDDAANPNTINDQTSAQVIPKVSITPQGETYVAWFDLDAASGYYQVKLQKMSITGVAQWQTPVLVSNHPSMTWLTDWDMTTDNDGNAVLVFQDIRNVTNNVYAYKVSPAGTMLWGDNGLALSADTDANISNMTPTLTCSTGNNIVVAWQHMSGNSVNIIYQAVSPAGQVLWGANGISMPVQNNRTTWPQLIPSINGDVLMKYYKDSGPTWAPTRTMWVKRISPTGTDVWTSDLQVQSQGGINAWTQWLSVSSDGNGGMILSWHDDRDANQTADAYVQHINADGTVAFTTGGVHVTTETNSNQFYPKSVYNPATQETFIYWTKENIDQNMWGIWMQKLNAAGDAQWGSTGMSYLPLGENPTYPCTAMLLGGNFVMVYQYGPQALNDQIMQLKAMAFSSAGQDVWSGDVGYVASTQTAKLHFDTDSRMGFAIVGWENGGGPSNIQAMRLNTDGTLGNSGLAPFNLTAELINNHDIQLSWEMPETLVPPSHYKIYRDNEFYMDTIDNAQTIIIGNPAPEQNITYTFYVTAVWMDGEESPPSNSVEITITPVSDPTALKTLWLQAAPNPFVGNVLFRYKGISSSEPALISVFDSKGRLVRSFALNNLMSGNTQWDGTDSRGKALGAGVYLIRMQQSGREVFRKVVRYR